MPDWLNLWGAAQGFNDSGMEDLLSGTVSGAFYLGGGAAPAIAGTINAVFGFGWACTGMGFLMLLQAVALLILLLFLRTPPSRARPAAKSPFHDSSQLPEHVDEEQPHDNGEAFAYSTPIPSSRLRTLVTVLRHGACHLELFAEGRAKTNHNSISEVPRKCNRDLQPVMLVV